MAALPCPALAADAVAAEAGLMTVVTAGAVALALAAGIWAVAEQARSGRLRRTLGTAAAGQRARLTERDALLSAGSEPVLAWGRDLATPLSYGGADALLDACLSGPDATALSAALDALGAQGEAFHLNAQDAGGRRLAVHGRAVGGMAAVWIADERPASVQPSAEFESALNALPIPVWLRDRALTLSWANTAYLAATGAADLATLRAQQLVLERSERDLAAAARSQNEPQEARRYAVVAGQRRALTLHEAPVEGLGIVGSALDVTEAQAAEAKLQQHIDAHADTLDKLATAVAIFDREQKLVFYNRAFAALWELPETWLDTHPSDGEVLDRLRETRKLPEQRDYQAWKRDRLAAYEDSRRQASEDTWHLPTGKTLRVVTQPHPFGGLTFLYEDVTEKLALESAYNTQLKVQSATLDTLKEAVAVFGPDGRLRLHNAAFLRIWELGAKALAGEPHVRAIAAAATERFGNVSAWEHVIQVVASGASGRADLGEIERGDRSVLALAAAPLPDGATLVTFTDVTDRLRIEAALRERNEALEAADNLKSDFIKHVSYELRTPLNAVLGFAEMLANSVPGQLNKIQAGYVQDIIAGGNVLKDLVNNILDLSLIESGALRLELGRIDLAELLHGIAATGRDWAAKEGLELKLELGANAGPFVGDERRIQQVVFNLLSNALKYTPAGGTIVLSGAIVGDDVQIAVSDNGPGLAPDVKATVFDRFASQHRAGQRAGAGLGLALVNRFVELHDGWVEIESGDGTLVRCHFPRRLRDEMTAGKTA